jgi:hypothetical protein
MSASATMNRVNGAVPLKSAKAPEVRLPTETTPKNRLPVGTSKIKRFLLETFSEQNFPLVSFDIAVRNSRSPTGTLKPSGRRTDLVTNGNEVSNEK